MKPLVCILPGVSYLLLIIWFAGCKNETQPTTHTQWTEINIQLDGQNIQILNIENRSGWNRIFMPEDTVEALDFSESQLDSIHDYVYAIIESQPVPDYLVTPEVAQNASFEILFSQDAGRSTRTTTSKQIQFQFIHNWKELSADTKELSMILARNMRLVQ